MNALKIIALAAFVGAVSSRHLSAYGPVDNCPSWAKPRSGAWVEARTDNLQTRAKNPFRLAFFGDSITNHLEEPQFGDFMKHVSNTTKTSLSDIGNFGISADTADTLMYRLCHGGLPRTLDTAFVHIGTNNLKLNDSSESVIAQKIYECVRYIRTKNPKTKVVVSNIFNRKLYADKRTLVNSALETLLKQKNDRLVFFTKAGNLLNYAANTADGLHPTPAGWFQVWEGAQFSVRKALATTP